jgi:NosR/NirI family transcriptional regulator, nitrous oxide reductase regulator
MPHLATVGTSQKIDHRIARSSMSDLPIIAAPVQPKSRWRATVATWFRCVAVAFLAMLLRTGEARHTGEKSADSTIVVDTNLISDVVADVIDVMPMDGGLWQLRDASEDSTGFAALTPPNAAHVIGYRGSSNVLLILNEQLQVVNAKLLSSDDTPEHVDAILRDGFFFPQFNGWTLGDPGSFTDVDATSGATLTGLAIAEAIAVRLGSEKPSLRFPDALNTEDLKTVFDTSTDITVLPIDGTEAKVVDSNGIEIGRLIRTGPLVDSLTGYQGPSEVIMALDADGRTQKLALRRTYDNKPYVDYLNDEPWFWNTFQRKQLGELAALDLEGEQVEGVSGATMTSMAVAETIVAAARQYEQRQFAAAIEVQRRRIHWSRHDTGTAFVLIGAVVIGTTRLRGSRRIQICWNVFLTGYFGLVTGNLISLAVVTGWAAKGFAWRLAPGLAAVIIISFILPVTTKRNLYCSHICPHGAAQQLLRRGVRWTNGVRWLRRMKWLPGMTLATAVVVTMPDHNWNLAAWEPFNAYIWYVAGAGSIALAVASLALSTAVPMAYCRYACGTGRLLEYLRHSARSDRFLLADGVLLALLLLSAIVR